MGLILCFTFCLSASLVGFTPDFCLKNAEPTTPALTCSPKDYYNSTTKECEPKYEWVNYTTGLENDTKLVYIKDNDVVTRWIQNNDNVLVIAMSIYELKTESDYLRNTSASYKRLEVLLAEPDLYEWKSWSNGTAIPYNAIEGGLNRNNTVHVCRFKLHDEYCVGMVNRDDRICYSEFWNIISKSTYDLLVYKP